MMGVAMRIFNASICGKLTYGLFTATLNAKEKRKLDGFQARCLRRILRIPHSHYSRISNATVLSIAGDEQLSQKMLQQQKKYWQKLVARDAEDPARKMILKPDSNEMRILVEKRRRGRPRKRWTEQLEANST